MTTPSRNPTDLEPARGGWRLDPDRTSIEFHTTAFWLIPTKGTFRAIEGAGTVAVDGGVTGSLVVDATSVHTKIRRRDAHLKSADFLDVGTYPTITYEVTGGRPTGPGAIDLDGTLSVQGETRPLTLSANFIARADRATVWVDVTIDRSAWGLTSRPFGAGLKTRLFVRAEFDRVGDP